jgi:hypothetical protein
MTLAFSVVACGALGCGGGSPSPASTDPADVIDGGTGDELAFDAEAGLPGMGDGSPVDVGRDDGDANAVTDGSSPETGDAGAP